MGRRRTQRYAVLTPDGARVAVSPWLDEAKAALVQHSISDARVGGKGAWKLVEIDTGKVLASAENGRVFREQLGAVTYKPPKEEPMIFGLGDVECPTRGPFRWADVSLCLRRTGNRKARVAIDGPKAVAEFVVKAMPELANEAREHVFVIPVDVKLKPLGIAHISTGTLNASFLHPREVLQILSAVPTSAFFLVHNHPSGDSELSSEDRAIATRMQQVGDVVGIRFMDFLALAPQPDGSWEFASTSGDFGHVAAPKTAPVGLLGALAAPRGTTHGGLFLAAGLFLIGAALSKRGGG